MVFSENSLWTKSPRLRKSKKPLILVTYDVNIFNANDGKRRVWKKKGKSPLRPKRKKKGIMVSEFLIPVGRLRILDFMPDHQLPQDKDWPFDENQKPR